MKWNSNRIAGSGVRNYSSFIPHPSSFALCVALLAAAHGLSLAADPDPFATAVRPTEPLSADDERRALIVPEGFEVTLVAAEPDVAKPLNMAFDDRGRLWVSDTVEYPYAAKVGQPGRDTIKILEDADGDGRAERVTTFADGLNIPIGLLPYGRGVIAFSIPHIWYMEDVDGDGRCDRRSRLYGPFAYDRDTHGLNNAFRRGFDGWIYACHGFNNQSTVSGADGHQITMRSGNIYRFRPDGSRIEHFTHGQVNPFGMAQDGRGNLFTADCHSKPIYQLLRGGYYPSFGAPHDGLGFAPEMMRHLHGSTAIAGVAVYEADAFPAEYRGSFFTGNVATGRVNRDSVARHGSTLEAKEEADFLVSRDPWFRPVDLQIGPDGALYIADFYNRIIGHYEVPLDHPGRDRDRGRIWRVAWRGDADRTHDAATPDSAAPNPDSPDIAAPDAAMPDFASLPTAELIAELRSPNLTRRLLAMHRLADHVDDHEVTDLKAAFDRAANGDERCHLLWVLARRDALDDARLSAAAHDHDPRVRTHAMKILAETKHWLALERALAASGLADTDAFVRRAAAEAMSLHPRVRQVRTLVEASLTASTSDTHLVHALRMALRNQLREPANLARAASMTWSDEERLLLVRAALGLASPESADFLLRHIAEHDIAPAMRIEIARHVARHAHEPAMATLADLAQTQFAADLAIQADLLAACLDGLEARAAMPNESIRRWGQTVAASLLEPPREERLRWTSDAVDADEPASPWAIERRASSDAGATMLAFSSLPRGETLRGVYRSAEFVIPPTFSFDLAGHDGSPARPPAGKNLARLRLAETGEVLREAAVPRNDRPVRIEWSLDEHAGKRGFIELVDDHAGRAYAWIAAGGFSCEALNPRSADEQRSAGLRLAERLRLTELRPNLLAILDFYAGDAAARADVVRAIAAVGGDGRLAAIAPVLAAPHIPRETVDCLSRVVAAPTDGGMFELIERAVRAAPASLLGAVAIALSADPRGAEALVALVERGRLSVRNLTAPAVSANLAARGDAALVERVSALVKDLPPIDAELERIVAERRQRFAAAERSSAAGAELFTKHCGACHQLAGRGVVVGPQLDGIGNRGADRMIEDVLDPNRAVDVAFRTTTLVLADGRITIGLVRREDDDAVTLVDQQGKELVIKKAEVEDRIPSSLSLMPANIAETLTEAQFFDLVAYLLEQRQ